MMMMMMVGVFPKDEGSNAPFAFIETMVSLLADLVISFSSLELFDPHKIQKEKLRAGRNRTGVLRTESYAQHVLQETQKH